MTSTDFKEPTKDAAEAVDDATRCPFGGRHRRERAQDTKQQTAEGVDHVKISSTTTTTQ